MKRKDEPQTKSFYISYSLIETINIINVDNVYLITGVYYIHKRFKMTGCYLILEKWNNYPENIYLNHQIGGGVYNYVT